MSTEFRIARAEHVPVDADVGHFDQLDEAAQTHLVSAVRDRNLPAAVTAGDDAFDDFDVVRFTDYYRIESAVAGEASEGSFAASD